MPTLVDAIFVLALVLPPLAVLVAAAVLLASSVIGWRVDAQGSRVAESQPLPLHRPVAH
jgi:hypothetical protein